MLIPAIALLHQHQRPRRTVTHHGQAVAYIEVTPADIVLANRLAGEVLGRSLDELPPGTRRLLDALDTHVTAQATADAVDRSMVRFSRRDLRDALGWGDTQLKVHLARLVDLELVIAHRAERGSGFVYELAYTPTADGNRFVIGLTDPSPLVYDTDRSGSDATRSGSGRGLVGGWSAPGRDPTEEPAALVNGHEATAHDTEHDKSTDPEAEDGDVVVVARRAG